MDEGTVDTAMKEFVRNKTEESREANSFLVPNPTSSCESNDASSRSSLGSCGSIDASSSSLGMNQCDLNASTSTSLYPQERSEILYSRVGSSQNFGSQIVPQRNFGSQLLLRSMTSRHPEFPLLGGNTTQSLISHIYPQTSQSANGSTNEREGSLFNNHRRNSIQTAQSSAPATNIPNLESLFGESQLNGEATLHMSAASTTTKASGSTSELNKTNTSVHLPFNAHMSAMEHPIASAVLPGSLLNPTNTLWGTSGNSCPQNGAYIPTTTAPETGVTGVHGWQTQSFMSLLNDQSVPVSSTDQTATNHQALSSLDFMNYDMDEARNLFASATLTSSAVVEEQDDNMEVEIYHDK